MEYSDHLYTEIIDSNQLPSTKYKAENIALYIIHECIAHHKPISNLTLQYMLTLVQTKSLVQRDEPLFEDDICATFMGPGVPDVYRLFAIWGGSRITYMSKYPTQYIYPQDIQFINEVVHDYWEKAPWEMFSIMQDEGTAYYFTKMIFGEDEVISHEMLKRKNKIFKETSQEEMFVPQEEQKKFYQKVKKLIRKE